MDAGQHINKPAPVSQLNGALPVQFGVWRAMPEEPGALCAGLAFSSGAEMVVKVCLIPVSDMIGKIELMSASSTPPPLPPFCAKDMPPEISRQVTALCFESGSTSGKSGQERILEGVKYVLDNAPLEAFEDCAPVYARRIRKGMLIQPLYNLARITPQVAELALASLRLTKSAEQFEAIARQILKNITRVTPEHQSSVAERTCRELDIRLNREGLRRFFIKEISSATSRHLQNSYFDSSTLEECRCLPGSLAHILLAGVPLELKGLGARPERARKLAGHYLSVIAQNLGSFREAEGVDIARKIFEVALGLETAAIIRGILLENPDENPATPHAKRESASKKK